MTCFTVQIVRTMTKDAHRRLICQWKRSAKIRYWIITFMSSWFNPFSSSPFLSAPYLSLIYQLKPWIKIQSTVNIQTANTGLRSFNKIHFIQGFNVLHTIMWIAFRSITLEFLIGRKLFKQVWRLCLMWFWPCIVVNMWK